jgi:hypothetical protein
MATLKRVSDGAGDQGVRVEAIKWNEDGTKDSVVDNKPVVGCSLLVGSLTARTYSEKDYWLTTEVTEILEEKYDDKERLEYCKFKTGNSVYEIWK